MSRRKDKAERIKRRSRAFVFVSGMAVFCGCSLWLAGCTNSAEERKPETELESARDIQDGMGLEDTLAVVNFDHELDGYEPLKRNITSILLIKWSIHGGMRWLWGSRTPQNSMKMRE